MFSSRYFARRAFSTRTQLASLTQPGTSYAAPNQLFINGQWCDAKSGETFDVLNPGTGELITKVAAAGAEDVEVAVKAAADASGAWAGMNPMQRGRVM